jgi:hypothetical protein
MNSKDKNYKEYLKVNRRKWEVLGAQRNLGYEPLDEPYQKGWDAYWVLRKDVSRRSDADDLQFILDNFGKDIWCDNIFFLKWDRSIRRYTDINPHIRAITEREWEKLPATCKKWFKVMPIQHGHYHPWWYTSTYTCVIPLHFLVKEKEPSMVTHKRVIDNLLEQEWAELSDLEDRLIDYRGWYKMGHKSGKSYKQYRNRQFRGKEKRAIKKAMRTGDWDGMILPKPRRCILWDMY